MNDLNIRSLYTNHFEGLYEWYTLYDSYIKEHNPNLHTYMQHLQLEPCLYTSGWFLSLFTNTLNIQDVKLLFDNYFNHDRDKYIFISAAYNNLVSVPNIMSFSLCFEDVLTSLQTPLIKKKGV